MDTDLDSVSDSEPLFSIDSDSGCGGGGGGGWGLGGGVRLPEGKFSNFNKTHVIFSL